MSSRRIFKRVSTPSTQCSDWLRTRLSFGKDIHCLESTKCLLPVTPSASFLRKAKGL